MSSDDTQQKLQAFWNKHSRYQPQLDLLRSVVLDCGLSETIKWGAPVYTLDDKNLVGLGAFKSYVGLWFFQGALLSDPDKVLVNAQENKTKALRQWRFHSIDEMDAKQIKRYVLETIELHRAGKVVASAKPIRKAMTTSELCEELQTALAEDKTLAKAFNALTPGRQKQYNEHIGSAKQVATRLKRVDQARPLILSGVGLYDKYKDC